MSEASPAVSAAPAAPVSAGRAIAKYTAIITAAGLLGKVLGLLRESFIGNAFGAGPATDALFVALSVPNTLATVVAGGGLRVAFQPELARWLAKDKTAANRLASAVVVPVAAMAVLLGAGLAVFASPVSALVSEGLPDLPQMMRLLAPMLPLMVLLDLFIGLLHARLHFTWPALEAAIRNGAIALAVAGLAFLGVKSVAVGHLAGTGLVVAGCALAAWQAGVRFVRPGAEERAALKRILLAAGPAILGSATYPLMALVDRAMASSVGPGAVSALAYADPLWQAGLVVAGPVSTVALPVLADLAARGDERGFATTTSSTTRATVFLTAPLAAMLAALAGPAVQVLYLRGKFGADAAALTGEATVFLALCLPSTAAQGVTLRALQARGKFGAIARISVITVAAHAVLNWALMQHLGVRGIALSMALSAVLQLALLDRELRLPAPGRARFLGNLLVSSALAYGAALAASHAVRPLAVPLVDALARLAAGGVAGLVAYLLVARVARMDELGQALRFARRNR